MAGRVQVYCGCSIDGFIAGEDDDLSWLPPAPEGGDGGFGAFMATIGAILMGRRSYDVVVGLGDEAWMYGDTPLLIATHRSLDPIRPTVRAVEGDIDALVTEARTTADSGDVYIDGGRLIRQALDAGLVDDVTVTFVPMILGRGIPLFAGASERRALERVAVRELGGDMAQLVYRVRR
jgi:dihydrofolate reductase